MGGGCCKSCGNDVKRLVLPVAPAHRLTKTATPRQAKSSPSRMRRYLSYARARATSARAPPPHAAASSASLLASSLLRSCMWHLQRSSSARTRRTASLLSRGKPTRLISRIEEASAAAASLLPCWNRGQPKRGCFVNWHAKYSHLLQQRGAVAQCGVGGGGKNLETCPGKGPPSP